MPASSAFELLHPTVQRWIYEQNWGALRDVQERAIPEILAGTRDVVLSAATASGKTEAAFLPICSRAASEEFGGLSVLYVAPLKALINDQFRRLDLLTEALEIPVAKWHGDVDANKKRALFRNPQGFLLITPESLEAILSRNGTKLPHFFKGLRYVVVDELHAFIASERGTQLQSLLHRIEAVVGRRVTRVALSATLADMRSAAEFLRPGDGEAASLLVSTSEGVEIAAQMRGYLVLVPKPNDGTTNLQAGKASRATGNTSTLIDTASLGVGTASSGVEAAQSEVGQSSYVLDTMLASIAAPSNLVDVPSNPVDVPSAGDAMPTYVYAAPTHIDFAPTHVYAAPTRVYTAPTHPDSGPTHPDIGPTHVYTAPTHIDETSTQFTNGKSDETTPIYAPVTDSATLLSSELAQRLAVMMEEAREAGEEWEEDDDLYSVRDAIFNDRAAIATHLFDTLRGGHHLIFANARTEVEAYTDLLGNMAMAARVPNPFFPHHGSLSKEIREETEMRLKDPERPATAICTSTLEMGIDIGSMESVAQVGSAPSVSSLRQRLGRSGRRGEPARLRLYTREIELTDKTSLQDALRASTVEQIAMMRLLLTGYNEPAGNSAMHLSTLVQQSLSLLAQTGGMKANTLWKTLCKTGAFRNVDSATFVTFLKDLHAHELVQQMPDGELIVGLTGERLVNHYTFYAAFNTPEEYRLVSDGKPLGTLPIENPLLPDSFLVYAGRRWKVIDVDTAQKVANLKPARGGRPPAFGGSGIWVSGAVRREMRTVYGETEVPMWLDKVAKGFLAEGRDTFGKYLLHSKRVIKNGAGTLVFLWDSDACAETLRLALNTQEFKATGDGVCLSIEEASERNVMGALRTLAMQKLPKAEALAAQVPNKATEKHDGYLSEPLLNREYAARFLDVAAADAVVAEIVANGG